MSPKSNFHVLKNIKDATLNFMDDKKSLDELEQGIEIEREIIRIKIAKEYFLWFCNVLWRDRLDLEFTEIRIIATTRFSHKRKGRV